MLSSVRSTCNMYLAFYLCTRKQVGGQVDFQSCTVRSLTKRFGVLRQ